MKKVTQILSQLTEGGSGGNWSNAANWSLSGVPTATDHVSIGGNTSVPAQLDKV
jgi:hypothetical protein